MRNLKRVLSLALALVMVLGMMVITTSAADFTDADEITYTEAVEVLAGVGLYKGDNAGNVNPTDVLTRKDAATLMARIILGDKIAGSLNPTKQIFADVATDHWAAAAIEYCYNIGMIAGYTDANGNLVFNPNGKLTGTAFAKLLLCALGYDAGAEGYETPAWEQNINADALAENLYIEDVKITDELTREGAAQMILQVLERDTVRYITSYDYSTGANVVTGPWPNADTFADKYFPTLTKDTDGNYAMWGRPYEYIWTYQGKEIYSVMKTPVKTYTEAVYECDIAEDLGLKKDAAITKWTWNNEKVDVDGEEIELLATKTEMGAQGRLLEIYKSKTGYEIVEIDTWLAQVTDVTECTYDRNGHLDEKAELFLDIYDEYTDEIGDAYADSLVAEKDWNYKVNEWLLVNYDEKNEKPVIVGAPETMTGAQTAWTYNDETHEVEDEIYSDAYNFLLDQTEWMETSDHVWFFDQYGNLIGAIDPAKAPDTFGVLSDIYWKDSRDGETGYAYGKITYMDGSYEWKTIAKIVEDDETVIVLEGVEGKGSDYAEGLVSSTKQYNKDEFTNKALYKISPSKDGLVLTETTLVEDGQLTTNKKTVVEDEVYVNSKTMFLAYNTKKGTYSAYVGVRNLPEYVNPEIDLWAATVVDGKDTNAEYIFVVDPATKKAAAEVDMVVVLTDDTMKMKANLKDDAIVSYKYSNILVDGEPGSVVFDAENEALIDEFENELGIPMVLKIVDGVVDDVYTSDTHREVNEKPVQTFGKVGVLGAYCFYEPDDESLEINGTWYDVADAKLIGARSWKVAENNAMDVAIVYDEDLTVSVVYFYEGPFA